MNQYRLTCDRPLAIDLFAGLGGWSEGLLLEGWDVIGFDIERHVYGEHRYPAQLVVQDVLALHGSQFKTAALIVASQSASVEQTGFKTQGMNWSDRTKTDQDFTRIAGKQALEQEGIKQRGSGREWFAGEGKISRITSSKSPARKMASAMIAKIPLPLSRYIAATFKPIELMEAAE